MSLINQFASIVPDSPQVKLNLADPALPVNINNDIELTGRLNAGVPALLSEHSIPFPETGKYPPQPIPYIEKEIH
ncbi:MAG: hypothetical protein AB2L21_01130 [Anaerolineaceae bacterium]